MTTGRINPFISSRNFKFADGPAVDKFFTREMVKFAIRAPNPELATAESFKTAIGLDNAICG